MAEMSKPFQTLAPRSWVGSICCWDLLIIRERNIKYYQSNPCKISTLLHSFANMWRYKFNQPH